jgi:hypothetical protein
MQSDVQSVYSCHFETLGKFERWVVELVGCEADCVEQAFSLATGKLCPRSRRSVCFQSFFQRAVTQEAEDPVTFHVVFLRAVMLSPQVAIQDCFDSNAAFSVRLRVEKGLAVSHVHLRTVREVTHAEFVEVIGCDENLAASKVGFEESGPAVVAMEFFAVVIYYLVFGCWWSAWYFMGIS